MNRHRWAICGTLGWLAWAWVGLARAETIPPTNPATLMLDVNASVSLSLYQLDSSLPATITTGSANV